MHPLRRAAVTASLVALSLPILAAAQNENPYDETNAGIISGPFGEAQKKFETAGAAAYGLGIQSRSFEDIVGLIIQTFLGLLGVVFLGLAIYGGYLWMTARGNETIVEKAKETIKSAVIGLAIILAAYAITSFVISALVGATTGGQAPVMGT